MSKQDDNNTNQRNSIYYNQMLRASERKSKEKSDALEKSFASKEIDFSQYLLAPKGYEGIAYCFYFLSIPYLIGLTFLFFYIAEGVYNHFSLLDLTSFLIIWAIGYEITGSIILLIIFFSFVKYLKR